nr:hypothetical protein [Candidatus Arsenophonus triatominarum]
MSVYPCIKDIYKIFLQVSRVKYSGLALSEVSPSPLSHDTINRWLKSRCFRPKDLWRLVETSIARRLNFDYSICIKNRSSIVHPVSIFLRLA